MFQTVPLSISRRFSPYTQQTHITYTKACTHSKPVWHIPLLCVQWKTPDDGQRNCPKHVEFYSKNKFQKLVYLIHFIIRIYHDARSPECQRCTILCFFLTFLLYCIPIGHTSTDFVLYEVTDELHILFCKLLKRKSIWHRPQMSSSQMAFIHTFLIWWTFNVAPGK